MSETWKNDLALTKDIVDKYWDKFVNETVLEAALLLSQENEIPIPGSTMTWITEWGADFLLSYKRTKQNIFKDIQDLENFLMTQLGDFIASTGAFANKKEKKEGLHSEQIRKFLKKYCLP